MWWCGGWLRLRRGVGAAVGSGRRRIAGTGPRGPDEEEDREDGRRIGRRDGGLHLPKPERSEGGGTVCIGVNRGRGRPMLTTAKIGRVKFFLGGVLFFAG